MQKSMMDLVMRVLLVTLRLGEIGGSITKMGTTRAVVDGDDDIRLFLPPHLLQLALRSRRGFKASLILIYNPTNFFFFTLFFHLVHGLNDLDRTNKNRKKK